MSACLAPITTNHQPGLFSVCFCSYFVHCLYLMFLPELRWPHYWFSESRSLGTWKSHDQNWCRDKRYKGWQSWSLRYGHPSHIQVLHPRNLGWTFSLLCHSCTAWDTSTVLTKSLLSLGSYQQSAGSGSCGYLSDFLRPLFPPWADGIDQVGCYPTSLGKDSESSSTLCSQSIWHAAGGST